MVWRELITALQNEGYPVNADHVRYLLNIGRVSRPVMDASLRFIYTDDHLQQARNALDKRRARRETAKAKKARLQAAKGNKAQSVAAS